MTHFPTKTKFNRPRYVPEPMIAGTVFMSFDERGSLKIELTQDNFGGESVVFGVGFVKKDDLDTLINILEKRPRP